METTFQCMRFVFSAQRLDKQGKVRISEHGTCIRDSIYATLPETSPTNFEIVHARVCVCVCVCGGGPI
jgi:hypothetical protein